MISIDVAEDVLFRPTQRALLDASRAVETNVVLGLSRVGAFNDLTGLAVAVAGILSRGLVWLLPIVGPRGTWVPREDFYRREHSTMLRDVIRDVTSMVDPCDVRGDLRGTITIRTEKGVTLEASRAVLDIMLTDASQDTATGTLSITATGEQTKLELTMRGHSKLMVFDGSRSHIADAVTTNILSAIVAVWSNRPRTHPPYVGAIVQHKIDPAAEPYLWLWRPLVKLNHQIDTVLAPAIHAVEAWFGSAGVILLGLLFLISPFAVPAYIQALAGRVLGIRFPDRDALADADRADAIAARLVTLTDFAPDVWSVSFWILPEGGDRLYLDVLMANQDETKQVESRVEIVGDRVTNYDVGNLDVSTWDMPSKGLLPDMTCALAEAWDPPAWARLDCIAKHIWGRHPDADNTDTDADDTTTEETEPTYE